MNIRKSILKNGESQVKNYFFKYLKTLWPNGKPVAEPKLKDIKSCLHLIPAADHLFYNNLISDLTVEEDIDGYNGEIDFELEDNS